MAGGTNRTLCTLYYNAGTGNCASSMKVDDSSWEFNTTCLGMEEEEDFYFEQIEDDAGVLTCYEWERTPFSDTKIIMPAIFFILLCILLGIMIYKSVYLLTCQTNTLKALGKGFAR
eukprot:sb/3476627/